MQRASAVHGAVPFARRLSVVLLLLAACSAAVVLGTVARCQADEAYPSRLVRIIVPSAAGGTTDIVARVIARSLSKSFGVNFIVEQKVGGNTNIGSAFVSKAAPDGYTLLVNTDTLISNVATHKNAGYDVINGFAPVMMLTKAPGALAVRSSLGVSSLEEFVQLARSKGKALSVASTGTGTVSHLTGIMFREQMNLPEWTDVPYQGSAKVVSDLLGGHVDAAFAMIVPFVPAAKSGDIKLLAVTTKARSPTAPTVPTIAERTSLTNFEVVNWTAMFAPAGTPEAIVTKLATAIEVGLKDPEVVGALSALGLEPAGEGPKALAQTVRANVVQWQDVVQRAGLNLN
ncbi:tripartite tricarboxylate transporter substrate binding protein [Microbacteriaceae bacterium K1510]|nr:tripartite tricarboxylate transporter substrate binding protein [Microbacteriaceae bacterium K1510]